MRFPISGVSVSPLVPLLAALGISTCTSMGGVSGAFVLLPFQVSVLGFVGPAVTPTNHLFNVIAIPSGVLRFIREGRMVWPLTIVILVGTVPGVILGSLARIRFLPNPTHFKLFIGLVLLLIGGRLALKVLRPARAGAAIAGEAAAGAPSVNGIAGERAAGAASDNATLPAATTSGAPQVKTRRFDLRRLEYEYAGQTHSLSTAALFLLTALVGVIGGAYGVGGGAIIAPFLVSMFDLPVHTIAGATLSGTCFTSVVGVLFFTAAQPLLGVPGLAPDWLLGGLFGIGGLFGMYSGARLQKHVPARAIEATLALLVTAMAAAYLVGFFSA